MRRSRSSTPLRANALRNPLWTRSLRSSASASENQMSEVRKQKSDAVQAFLRIAAVITQIENLYKPRSGGDSPVRGNHPPCGLSLRGGGLPPPHLPPQREERISANVRLGVSPSDEGDGEHQRDRGREKAYCAQIGKSPSEEPFILNLFSDHGSLILCVRAGVEFSLKTGTLLSASADISPNRGITATTRDCYFHPRSRTFAENRLYRL